MISIIIPAYNAENTISQTLDSVLSQSYKNYEIIVIDDCSTDKTKQIIDEYCLKHSNIRGICNEVNSGVGKSRNIGIKCSQGDLIAFLDSDDLWEMDKLEKQFELYCSHPEAKIIYTGSSFINNQGKRLNSIFNVAEKVSYRQLLKQNIISCSSVVVRKELIEEHSFCDKINCHEDFATWLSILKDGGFAYGINEPLLVYRLTENSKSSNKLKAAIMNWNTYELVGLSFFEKLFYMMFYAINAVFKYIKIIFDK